MAEGDAPAERPYRWYVLALLTLSATLNGIDKHVVAALAVPLKQAFHLTDTEFGLIAGTFYSIGFVAGGIPITLLIDRTSRPRLLAAIIAIWSGATALAAATRGFAGLATVRTIVGAAEAGSQPLSMVLIADWFAPRRRGTALGLYATSSAVSMLISFSMAGAVAARWGWQAAFLITGLPGLALSLVMVLTLRERSAVATSGTGQAPPIGQALALFVRDRELLGIGLALILVIACQNGVMSFLTALLTTAYHLPPAQAGLTSGLVLGLSAALGMPAGGVLADRISGQGPAKRYASFALVAVALVPAGWLLALAPGTGLAVAGLFLFQFCAAAAFTTGLSLFLNAVPEASRGTLSSILSILTIAAGAGLGPPIAGAASDLFRAAGAATPLRDGLAATSLLAVLAGLGAWSARRRVSS